MIHRYLKTLWLECIFIILAIILIFISIKNTFINIDFYYENPKTLVKSDQTMETLPLEEYLKQINQLDNCTAILTVKDIQGFSLTSSMIEAMKNMGFDKADILLEHEYHSFIGIYSNGNVIYQAVGGDELLTYDGCVNGHRIIAKSATLKEGDTGIIYIDDVSYGVNSRGINIVLLDNLKDCLIDSIAYDTHSPDIAAYRIINGQTVTVTERTTNGSAN